MSSNHGLRVERAPVGLAQLLERGLATDAGSSAPAAPVRRSPITGPAAWSAAVGLGLIAFGAARLSPALAIGVGAVMLAVAILFILHE